MGVSPKSVFSKKLKNLLDINEFSIGKAKCSCEPYLRPWGNGSSEVNSQPWRRDKRSIFRRIFSSLKTGVTVFKRNTGSSQTPLCPQLQNYKNNHNTQQKKNKNSTYHYGKDKDKYEPTTQMHRAWLPRQQAHGLVDSANGGIADPCCSYFQREGD